MTRPGTAVLRGAALKRGKRFHCTLRASSSTNSTAAHVTHAERLASAEPAPAVVLVSSRTASSYRRRLADSPALGFVAKSELSGAALSALLASG